jgi:hypothetical protein
MLPRLRSSSTRNGFSASNPAAIAQPFVDVARESLGSLERLRRGLLGRRGRGSVALDESGYQTWIMKQINTRATSRSWSNNTFVVLMTSPLTIVKGEYHTGLATEGMIRCVWVHDLYKQSGCSGPYGHLRTAALPAQRRYTPR